MTFDIFNQSLARRDPVEEARFISLQRVRGYWEALIGPGGTLPGPEALDPRGLLPALEDVFLAERIGEGLLRLRIAGRRVSAPAGMDMQGLPLSALFLPEARPALAQMVERVCQNKALVTMELVAEGGVGRPALTARMLLLPLKTPQRGTASVLGCLSTLGEIGRTPRRFIVSGAVEERLGHTLPAGTELEAALAAKAPELPEFSQPGLVQPKIALPEDTFAGDATPFISYPDDFILQPVEPSEDKRTDERTDERIPGHPKLRLVHSQD